MMTETPVAFFIFNRPDLTSVVFDAIAAARPRKLYVIADGPRGEYEAEKTRQARAVIERVDWDCEVVRHFSDINLGCRQRVSSGIDFVFASEERAIILEDDCLPDPSFFPYCDALLERYANDERIMHISGGNYLFGQLPIEASYYFSRYLSVWGWATWRRAWRHYDVNLSRWPEAAAANLLERLIENDSERQMWLSLINRTWLGEIDTWDFQWTFTCWIEDGLTVFPTENMISNIGFREDATHTNTSFENLILCNMERHSLELKRHPEVIVRNEAADDIYIRNSFPRAFLPPGSDPIPFGARLRAKLKRTFGALVRSR